MGFFEYGKKETEYLKSKDTVLGAAIDRIGKIEREVDPDLFYSLVSSVVGQQISAKAYATVWGRVLALVGEVTPDNLVQTEIEKLQACGMSMRKAGYIKSTALAVHSGEIDLAHLAGIPDAEVCKRLVSLRGVGVWTAEMLMLFSLQRPDILSFGDLAIVRGMRMLYNLPVIGRQEFETIRARYSPYGSVASLYLWEISMGSLPELFDPAPPPSKK